jgi:glycosyltransferase involved in cell wall biosynthesis
VSEEVRDELVALGVTSAERFEVIALGLDLSHFVVGEAERARRGRQLRAAVGIPPEARVVTLIARLVPIKRVDRFLAIARRLAGELDDVWFLIVGDGELGDRLRALPQPERIVWAGFQRDVAAVCFASDVVVLTSDNEGTPVSLIEAQAAGVPVVSTRVGGAAAVVTPASGALVPSDDEDGFVRAVRAALERAAPTGDPRAHVLQTFSLDRLVADIDELYRRLLAQTP